MKAALADKAWDALPKEDRATPVKGLKPAIIVDVDETVLDNAPASVRQILEHRGFDEAQWGKWVEERKAKACPARWNSSARRRSRASPFSTSPTAMRA